MRKILSCLLACSLLSPAAALAWDPGASPFLDAPPANSPQAQLKTTYKRSIDRLYTEPSELITTPNRILVFTRAHGPVSLPIGNVSKVDIINGNVMQPTVAATPDYTIVGTGPAADWVRNTLRPGSRVDVDEASRQLSITWTPESFVSQVDEALEAARTTFQNDSPEYQEALNQAKGCRDSLATLHWQNNQLTPEFAATVNDCLTLARRALHRSTKTVPGEFRGIWVRPKDESDADIQAQLDTYNRLGIKDIFLETYFQGKTTYPSDVMAEYGLPVQHATYSGRDPVQQWITLARAAGIRVHVWAQIFFAGNKESNIEQYGPILQKYPQWRNIERNAVGKPTPVPSDVENGHYFIDPANPDVRAFLEKLLLEMVTRYQPDGLNLDYIRYPASARPNSGLYLSTNWGYTDYARKAFQAFINPPIPPEKLKELATPPKPIPADPLTLTPQSPLWPKWVAWRMEQISSFVSTVNAKARAVKPDLTISAVVFPTTGSGHTTSTDEFSSPIKLQDWPRWVDNGWVQALTPIGLTPTPEGLRQQSRDFRKLTKDKVPVYVGLFGLYHRMPPVDVIKQVEAVHDAGMPGMVLFESSRLNKPYIEALGEGPFRK